MSARVGFSSEARLGMNLCPSSLCGQRDSWQLAFLKPEMERGGREGEREGESKVAGGTLARRC